MLRSRMFTPGFRLFFGIFAFLLVGALVFGISSELQVTGQTVRQTLDQKGVIAVVGGPLSVGWKGGVGNHLGYTLLLGSALVAAFIAFVLIAFRDADPEAEAAILSVETVPLTKAPSGTNFAPVVGAFALGLLGVGWVISGVLFYVGIVLVLVVAAVWTLRAWAERATGDDQVNHEIYVRFIDPVRVPVVAALIVGFVVFGLSRVLLAAPDKNWSSLIFAGAAIVFFLGVLAVYFAPVNVRKVLTGALLAIGAVAVLAFGIIGIAKGERPVEHHGGAATETEHGLGPIGRIGA